MELDLQKLVMVGYKASLSHEQINLSSTCITAMYRLHNHKGLPGQVTLFAARHSRTLRWLQCGMSTLALGTCPIYEWKVVVLFIIWTLCS